MLNYQSQKWDEPQLTQSDFKAFFETSPQAMFVENRDGYVVSLNPSACQLWGASIDALIGKHASEILPPKLGISGIGSVRRSHYTRPDGSTIEVEVLSNPLTLGEDEAFLTCIWPAESQTNPSPPETETRDQLSSKMEALERLSKRVSHDFNNILTSIVGFSSLLQTDESLGEENQEHLNQILESTKQAEKLTGELVAFGRRAAPAPDAIFEPAETIKKVDPHIRRILGSRISLTTLCEEGVPAIAGDENCLVQILLQLAENASEALDGSADGELKIELCANDDSRGTILRVSDDGPGMCPVTAEIAFEPFSTTHQNQKMRGLGLARVYAAVRNLGGSAQLDSTEGLGTKFTFHFPAAPEPEPADEAAATPLTVLADPSDPASIAGTAEPVGGAGSEATSEPADDPAHGTAPAPEEKKKRSGLPGGTETILVVEDEPMVREIVVRSLTHLGYTVHKASDGQEGLERSRELADEIDLIFSDIVMPRLSGPEMIQKVREENRNTPVLFTTGFTESKHLLENGGDLREGIDLLQKPYTPNVLAERVREKLDSLIS